MNRILIVDDSRSIRKALMRLLNGHDYILEEAEDGYDGRIKVADFHPDLILLDLTMPGLSGLDLCRELKSNILTKNIYIIMLTASTSAGDEMKGFETGADDYVCKPYESDRLLARISRGLKESEVRMKSLRDPLTQLYNRRMFEVFYIQELARNKRYKRDLSLLFIDIDHFKIVNDTYGHNAGDMVLQTISELLNSECRGTDMAVRWGGEELLLLMPETPSEGAASKAESIRQKVEAIDFPDVGKVTVSIGVATLIADSPMDLIQSADESLYKAKASGRNRVVVHGESVGKSYDFKN